MTGTSEMLGYASMVGAAMCFASSLMLIKAYGDIIPPFGMTFVRWFGVAVILLPFQFWVVWRYHAVIVTHWRRLLVLGVTGMSIPALVNYFAIRTSSATNIALIISSTPIMVILADRLFLAEALSVRRLAGVIVAFVGVVVIILRGDIHVLQTLAIVPGDLWALTGTTSWAIYSLLIKPWRLDLPPMVQLIIIAAFAGLAALPFALYEAANTGPWAPGWRLPAIAVFSILVPGLGAFALHGICVRRLGIAHAAMVQYIVPIFVAIFATLLLGEKLEVFHAVGGAAVLGGVWLASKTARAPA